MRRLSPIPTVLALLTPLLMRAPSRANPPVSSSASPQSFLVVLVADPAGGGAGAGAEDLLAAERRVCDLLFKPGAVIPGRSWYRFGIDSMTLVESGPGPKSTETLSALRGHWDAVEADYARFLTRPRIKLRQSRFEELFRPQPRPHQLDLDRTLESSARDWMNGTPERLVVLRESANDRVPVPALVAKRFEAAKERFRLVSRSQKRIGRGYVVETADILPGPEPVPTPMAYKQPGLFGRALRVLLDLAGLVAAAAIARWAWIQRFRTRHFELWIPGFAGAFTLPRLSQNGQASFRARLPRYAGEPAAHLELPGRTVRALFYPRAKLQWDPRLRVDTLEPSRTECSLFRLPRFVRFVWVERPAEEGNLSLSIVRPRMLGGNDRVDIAVNFLALPRPSPE